MSFLSTSQYRGVYIDERRHRVLCDKVMSESRRTRTRHISSNLCLFERAEGGRSMGWFSERLELLDRGRPETNTQSLLWDFWNRIKRQQHDCQPRCIFEKKPKRCCLCRSSEVRSARVFILEKSRTERTRHWRLAWYFGRGGRRNNISSSDAHLGVRNKIERVFGGKEAAATQYLYTEKARRARRRHEESPVDFRRVGRRTDIRLPIVSFAHYDANVGCMCVEEKKLRAGARRNLYLKGANDQKNHESILRVFWKNREKQRHLSQL
jgi:hypothetical protein